MKWFRVLLLFALAACALTEDSAAPDTEAPAEEAPAVKDTFTEDERAAIEQTEEKHEFQAEVSRLMDIIINSLYSNREIFLRELISNSADAIDKVRFQSLTDKSVLDDTDQFEILIQANKDTKTISITDTGVGMTKNDLMKNLGVVAKSGTTEFLEAATSGQDTLNLIGQFGVGFYSVYLVADKVTVVSKNVADDQYVWESTAQSVYTVSKDPRGNTLKRGTSIILHLKDDAEEFLDNQVLEKLVKRYSQFINFPIKLHTVEQVTREVEKSKAEKDEEADKAEKDDVEVSEEEGEEEVEEETETTTEDVVKWKVLNDNQPLWTRNPSDVTQEEYDDFYKQLTKDSEGPLETMHFVAEGEISFKALLFIPKSMDQSVYEKFYEKNTNLKLYVRRVLISDEFDEFLPRYMNFVKGVVDSDDLPLNVSRETLAQSRVLKVMAKKLERKVLEMLRKIADRSQKDDDEDNEDADEADEETDYQKFWKNYGKSIKMGVMEDQKNKSKLMKLLRFKSTKSSFTSFEEYVDRMGEEQQNIWYITGETSEKIEANPVLEGFRKRDVEVLIMDEPVDEYTIQYIHEFDGVEPSNAGKQGEAPWKPSKAFLADREASEDLCKWIKEFLGDAVKKVEHSPKLVDSPAAITASAYGTTANYERVQQAQSLKNTDVRPADKNFEINWRHPVIQELDKLVKGDPESTKAKDMTKLLFQSAQIYSGYILHETEDFAQLVNSVVAEGLGVDKDAKVAEEPEEDEEDEEPEPEAEEAEEAVDEASE